MLLLIVVGVNYTQRIPPAWMPQEQLQSRLLLQHGQLHGVIVTQIVPSRSEQHRTA